VTKKRFSMRQIFNKESIAKVPKNKPIVYEILNKTGKNVYTGHAKRGQVSKRLKIHLPGRRDAVPGSKFFRIKQLSSVKEAKTKEQEIIKREKPKFNIVGTNR